MRQFEYAAPEPCYFFAARGLVDNRVFISNRGRVSVFPLFRANGDGDRQPSLIAGSRRLNLKRPFLRALGARLQNPHSGSDGIPAGMSAEEILWYAYAVFYSQGYRSRYLTFLKIDFPRLPLTGNLDLFRELGRLGGELVALHLMESPKLDHFITTYTGPKNPEIGRVSWLDGTVWLDAVAAKKGQPTKPGTMGFRGVPEAVWNFRIGGYQICEKWLKDHKGRTLSDDDIAHYRKIVVALNETIRLMQEIEEVIAENGGWPDVFADRICD